VTKDIAQESLAFHRLLGGKLEVSSLVRIRNRDDLSLAYTPGVAAVSLAIAQKKSLAFELTLKGRTIAVISDGSAVLGLGNIGPDAALPVMEGKALLMKEFAGVDSIPLVINTQDTGEIIKFVKHVAPTFAGINLEDISAPRCFEIEEALQNLGIPVFHDDQHGTAIVVTAALHNAAKVVGKRYQDLEVVIVGAGAAGLSIAKMLLGLECQADSCHLTNDSQIVKDVIVVDRGGALVAGRPSMNVYKQAVAGVSNKQKKSGDLKTVSQGADVIIGVSGPGSITQEVVKKLAPKSIVFALANPTPEIMPQEAQEAGALVIATGRSDFDNQINNVLAFPGIFQAVIKGRLTKITTSMKLNAAQALADLVTSPTPKYIIPEPFDPRVVKMVSQAVLNVGKENYVTKPS